MLRIEGSSIWVTRGDSARFTVQIKGRELAEGARALFAVKKAPAWERGDAVIEKETEVLNGMVSVVLEPDDTDISAGAYAWDLRIKEPGTDGNNVLTPGSFAPFTVVEAIADAR